LVLNRHREKKRMGQLGVPMNSEKVYQTYLIS
jgi:hypothetical protein